MSENSVRPRVASRASRRLNALSSNNNSMSNRNTVESKQKVSTSSSQTSSRPRRAAASQQKTAFNSRNHVVWEVGTTCRVRVGEEWYPATVVGRNSNDGSLELSSTHVVLPPHLAVLKDPGSFQSKDVIQHTTTNTDGSRVWVTATNELFLSSPSPDENDHADDEVEPLQVGHVVACRFQNGHSPNEGDQWFRAVVLQTNVFYTNHDSDEDYKGCLVWYDDGDVEEGIPYHNPNNLLRVHGTLPNFLCDRPITLPSKRYKNATIRQIIVPDNNYSTKKRLQIRIEYTTLNGSPRTHTHDLSRILEGHGKMLLQSSSVLKWPLTPPPPPQSTAPLKDDDEEDDDITAMHSHVQNETKTTKKVSSSSTNIEGNTSKTVSKTKTSKSALCETNTKKKKPSTRTTRSKRNTKSSTSSSRSTNAATSKRERSAVNYNETIDDDDVAPHESPPSRPRQAVPAAAEDPTVWHTPWENNSSSSSSNALIPSAESQPQNDKKNDSDDATGRPTVDTALDEDDEVVDSSDNKKKRITASMANLLMSTLDSTDMAMGLALLRHWQQGYARHPTHEWYSQLLELVKSGPNYMNAYFFDAPRMQAYVEALDQAQCNDPAGLVESLPSDYWAQCLEQWKTGMVYMVDGDDDDDSNNIDKDNLGESSDRKEKSINSKESQTPKKSRVARERVGQSWMVLATSATWMAQVLDTALRSAILTDDMPGLLDEEHPLIRSICLMGPKQALESALDACWRAWSRMGPLDDDADWNDDENDTRLFLWEQHRRWTQAIGRIVSYLGWFYMKHANESIVDLVVMFSNRARFKSRDRLWKWILTLEPWILPQLRPQLAETLGFAEQYNVLYNF